MRLLTHLRIVALLSSISLGCQSFHGPEQRIIRYLKGNIEPGERLVFTAPEERAVLDKLNAAFFRIPLFVIEFEKRLGRLPTLEDIASQFDFYGPEAADVVLSIMESDPRVPQFIQRDPETHELTGIDIALVQADERFNQALERTLIGWEGRAFPAISGTSFAGRETSIEDFENKTLLVYVWFTNCPPCVKIGPELVALQQHYSGERFSVLGLNADRVLKLEYDDVYRADYAKKIGINYTNLHLTPKVRAWLGNVNIFPTLFLVSPGGTILKHYVNYQSPEVLRTAVEDVLSLDAGE